ATDHLADCAYERLTRASGRRHTNSRPAISRDPSEASVIFVGDCHFDASASQAARHGQSAPETARSHESTHADTPSGPRNNEYRTNSSAWLTALTSHHSCFVPRSGARGIKVS